MALNCSSLSIASSSTAPSAPHISSASSSFLTSSASARMLTPMSSISHAPLRMRASITCSSLESDQDADARTRSTSHAILTGLLATGAALSVFAGDIVSTPAPAHAFFGPLNGRAGEEAVAKSKDILKRADKLDDRGMTGPGKVSGTASNSAAPGTLSQKVATAMRDGPGKRDQNVFGTGGNALEKAGSNIAGKVGDKKGELKSAADNVVGQAKNVTNTGALENAGGKIASKVGEKKGALKSAADNVVGQVKNVTSSGDLKGAADKAIGQTKSNADNALGMVKNVTSSGDLKGAADKAVGQTKSNADNALGMAKNKADGAMGMAKSKANDIPGGNPAGGIIGSIKEGVQGIKESVAQNSSDAKNAVGAAANKVQGSMQ